MKKTSKTSNQIGAYKDTRTYAEKICDKLHEEIQFYNEFGKPDNHGVLTKIEQVLKRMKKP